MSFQNAMIGWPRYTPVMTLSGGSWEADYPVTNLYDEIELARVARTTDLTLSSCIVKATLPSLVAIRMIALVRHNMTTAAKWRIRLYEDDAWSTLVYDSGWVYVWPPIDIDREWEDDNYWECTYPSSEIEGTQWMALHLMDERQYCQSLQVDLDDESNTQGYIQAGLLEVARDWEFGTNFAYGMQYGFRGRSVGQEAEGGAKYFERRAKPRTYSLDVPFMLRSEVLSRGFELQRLADIDTPFLFVASPGDAANWHRDAALVRNVDISPLRRAAFGRDGLNLNLEEVL